MTHDREGTKRTSEEQRILDQMTDKRGAEYVAENEELILAQARLVGTYRNDSPRYPRGPSPQRRAEESQRAERGVNWDWIGKPMVSPCDPVQRQGVNVARPLPHSEAK